MSLGGRAMVIVHDDPSLERYISEAVDVSQDRPILIDKFLEDAFEVDVDAVADGRRVVIGGIMEHIEEAGIHSGDSSCVLPTYMVKPEHLETMRNYTRRLALELKVVGLMNVQYAIKEDVVYVLEVNPRASRTVPFVSKATGVPLAKVAVRLMTGRRLEEFGLGDELPVDHFFVKSPVFPFVKFPGVDTILGPEMRVYRRGDGRFRQLRASLRQGSAQRRHGASPVRHRIHQRKRSGQTQRAPDCSAVASARISPDRHRRHPGGPGGAGHPGGAGLQGQRGAAHIVDLIKSGQVDLVLNTPLGKDSFFDESAIRRAAVQYNVPCITTLSGGAAVASGISALQRNRRDVRALQDYHRNDE